MKRTWYWQRYPENGQKGIRHYYFRDSGWVMDHIKPIAEGGPQFDLSNLQTLCPECNAKKTSADISRILSKPKFNPKTMSLDTFIDDKVGIF